MLADDERRLEDRLEDASTKHLRGRTARRDAPGAHQDDLIGVGGGEVEIVEHDEAGDAALGHLAAEDVEHVERVADVEVRGRLVEEEDVRPLDEGASQRDPPLLTARERVDGPIGDTAQIARAHRLVDRRAILGRLDHPSALVRRASHRDDLADAKPERDLRVLVHDREARRDFAAPEAGERHPTELDRAGPERETAGQRTDERRFPRTVGAEDCGQEALPHVQVDAAEGLPGAVTGDAPQHSKRRDAFLGASGRLKSAPHVWKLACPMPGMVQWNKEERMETTTGSAEKPRRVIKRYSNRKLYDTKDSRYVTLQQIGEMVRAGEEVQIIDNATKEDKTEVTLALIISEDLKAQPRSVPLGTLRDLIQERGERLLNQLREGPIGRLIPGQGEEGAAVVEHAEAPPAIPDAEKSNQGKGRLSGIVESSKQTIEAWQHTIDERIRAVLPMVGHFRDLQSEVKRLAQRVEELEVKLQSRGGPPKE